MNPDSKKRIRDQSEVLEEKTPTPVCPWSTLDPVDDDEWDQADNCQCKACLKEEERNTKIQEKFWIERRDEWTCPFGCDFGRPDKFRCNPCIEKTKAIDRKYRAAMKVFNNQFKRGNKIPPTNTVLPSMRWRWPPMKNHGSSENMNRRRCSSLGPPLTRRS